MKVTNFLNDLGISYQLLHHDAVITTEQSREIVKVDNCSACKSLLVKDKKSDNYYLVVLLFDKRADMRGLASVVGCNKFEFATEEKLFELLSVKRGSVSPYAYLNNVGCNIPLLLDRDVFNNHLIKFHPCDNTMTVVTTTDDFMKYLSAINVKAILV